MCGMARSRGKILLITEWYPPAFRAGGPIQSVVGIAELLSKEADVFVLAGSKDLGAECHLDVKQDTWVELGESLHIQYVDPRKVTFEFWLELLKELNPSWVHLNSLYSRRFALAPLRAARRMPSMRIVLAPRGMLGEAARSIKPLKKKVFLNVARWLGIFEGIRWHASTIDEKQEVLGYMPNADVCIGQDLPISAPPLNPPRQTDAWRVVIVGRIHRVKNLVFGLKALLEAPSARPIEVDFIGPVEDETYQRELEAIAAASGGTKVRFLGGLPPTELRPHFQAAHYLLSSTTQENFGHSIVEAWAHGCPVLISDRTPWRDLEAKGIGWDWALEQETWQKGLTAALALNPEQWTAKSEAARAFFSDHVRSAEAERANLALFE